jgi:hypothetical protein
MESSSGTRRFRPDADVIAHRVGRETLLLHLRTNRFFELSDTAGRFWELLSAGRARAEIERSLLEEYDVPPAELQRNVDELLLALQAQELGSEKDEG